MQSVMPIVKYILTSNLINFIIMVWLLAIIVRKCNLGENLGKAVQKVIDKINESENAKLEAEKLLDKEKACYENLPNDLREIEYNTKSKISAFEKTIEKDTSNTIKNYEKSITRIISVEEDKISSLIKDATVTASIEAAKENLTQRLENNIDLHNKFIQNSLEELDRVEING